MTDSTAMRRPVTFIDLARQQQGIRSTLESAIARVLESARPAGYRFAVGRLEDL